MIARSVSPFVLAFLLGNGCVAAQEVASTIPTRAERPALREYRLGGVIYYAVDEIARHCGFSFEPSGDTATLRAGQRLLRFSGEPRRDANRQARVDGYQVWLNDPIENWQGRLMLSRVDYAKTLYPILWPQRRADSRVRTIVLDAGHGGNDEGTKGNGLTEKNLTLDVALRVYSKLAAANSDLRVYLTRQRDQFLRLEQRSQIARNARADLFVSIHFNSVGVGQVSGIETYALTPAGESSTAGKSRDLSSQSGNRYDPENIYLAHLSHAYVINGTGMPDRGVKRARFEVLNDAPCPAVLIECGFLDSSADAARIKTSAYRDALAASITRAILAYKQAFDP